jgi:hypothetical protein
MRSFLAILRWTENSAGVAQTFFAELSRRGSRQESGWLWLFLPLGETLLLQATSECARAGCRPPQRSWSGSERFTWHLGSTLAPTCTCSSSVSGVLFFHDARTFQVDCPGPDFRACGGSPQTGPEPGLYPRMGREGCDEIVVRRAGRYTSEDLHRALFPTPPRFLSLEEMKNGIEEDVKRRHARR